MIPINVAQIPSRLNDVPDTALELLCLGKAFVNLAVPQHGGLDCWWFRRKFWRGKRGRVVDCDDKGSAGGGLEGDFAEGERECGEELLSVLFIIHISIFTLLMLLLMLKIKIW
jgi:hypothetical protein